MSEVGADDLRLARLTAEQVHAMLSAGILREGAPIELIDGLLVYKDRSERGADPMTIGKKHNLVVQLLGSLAADLAAHGCYIQTQGPITLTIHDEPEPDGVVLRGQPRDFADRLPTAADAEAVIEVADASLETDRTRKLALYARAGIAQYVIVNLCDSVIEVYEEPVAAKGLYARTSLVRAGATVALRTGEARALTVDAARILP
jgi:hypothetical protein